jgi:hypothetical protein
VRHWSGQRPIPDLVALEADLLRALLEGGELAARDAGLQVIRIIDVWPSRIRLVKTSNSSESTSIEES